MWIAVVIFAVTYVLIAARRLHFLPIGRPAGALLGATAMVGFGVLSPEEAYSSIDHNTILLLFGMMLLTAELDGAFFDRIADRLARSARTPQRMLVSVCLFAAFTSALIVNDTVCLLFTPPIVRLCVRLRLPIGCFLIALATSANIGSAATLVGNPQNMLIGSMSAMPFLEFLGRSLPATMAGLAANTAMLLFAFRKQLADAAHSFVQAPQPRAAHAATDRRSVLVWSVLCAVFVAFMLGAHLGFSTLAGAMVVMLVSRKDPRETFARVDWTLLVFFCALFVVVHGFASTGLVEAMWSHAAPLVSASEPTGLAALSGAVVAGSNLVSNVPLVMLIGPLVGALGENGQGWILLAYISTVAGNLTLLGSVANIIVAEGAREHYTLGFFEYLRFGFLSTLVVVAVGVAVLALSV